MKICMPVSDDGGLASAIAPNFGSAPWLLIVDTDTRELDAIDAAGTSTRTGPIEIDMVVCRGIGSAMFQRLLLQGIRVFGTEALTVNEALTALEEDRLVELDAAAGCACGDAEKSACAEKKTSGCSRGGCGCH
ncbi:MAG: NifB/NifX family molybdenum-iron cluster-binding protein [Betaproteobacteria bacterium]